MSVFKRVKPTLKMLQDSLILVYFGNWIRSFHARNIGSVGQRDLNFQSWRSQKKVCHVAPALVEPLGPSLSWTRTESFWKFVCWQLCSPLIYRPKIPSTERFKPHLIWFLCTRSKRFAENCLCICPLKTHINVSSPSQCRSKRWTCKAGTSYWMNKRSSTFILW